MSRGVAAFGTGTLLLGFELGVHSFWSLPTLPLICQMEDDIWSEEDSEGLLVFITSVLAEVR
jgi:hypothetical protein